MAQGGQGQGSSGHGAVSSAVTAAAKRAEQPTQLTGGAIVAAFKATERETAAFRRRH